ncbi:chemotaxis response regulator protein-glutamate methylesterase [Liquorilactobacillus oeni DSM 19972]|uniref:Protein-glutamate methylesterase/protein-glutamine glutaminase n=2 Tax=Liquorilactobacillus oeni TaxID=303241 RepID=A0A0R1MLL7_9LACO|nr:chemotaxis response regulator protein-glutamate methylesterase [Liquorilactobacillus oeni DSM 19972]
MDILVADDSAFMRRVITNILAAQKDFRLAAVARNGKEAVSLASEQEFSLILLDVSMPVMDGLEALIKLKEQTSVPVIMLSGDDDRKTIMEALALGAVDFIKKPTSLMKVGKKWTENFCLRLKAVVSAEESNEEQLPLQQDLHNLEDPQPHNKFSAVVIGASTGGPGVLLKLIGQLPERIQLPIFIVQHMPKEFTPSFAARMNQETNADVVEAADEERILPKVYLCPGNYHMTVSNGKIKLDQRPKLHGTRPAVDYLFRSAAAVYGNQLTAVILTGMGKDGALGMKEVKKRGGYTIAQDEKTSVVFGMPRSAIEEDAVDEVLSLEMIGRRLRRIVG